MSGSEPAEPYSVLPPGLPEPEDDGAADHLPGRAVPAVWLASTSGEHVCMDAVSQGAERLVLYAYPRMGVPGEKPLVDDWDLIPGARGCTPQACAFRDHASDLRNAGAHVVGLSTQSAAEQAEAVARLHLPFPLVSDAALELTRALELPAFTVSGITLLKRLTLIVREGTVEHVFYPVFPPDTHAATVLTWLRTHPVN